MNLYLDAIIDHGQHPRHFADPLSPADIDYRADNPFCGDWLRLTARLNDEQRITAIAWQGEGCTICLASASMLGEKLLGRTLDDLRSLSKSDILAMLGIELSQTRLKCALLSLQVFMGGAYGLTHWTGSTEPPNTPSQGAEPA